MAAPQIPNLNTLRGRGVRAGIRGGRRGRGRGRGSFAGEVVSSREEEEAIKDHIIQQTDLDASLSRLSAVQLGYLHDPFAHLFVSSEPQRRLPIMNRGTYVRSEAIDILLKSFLKECPSTRKQIISLGAGSDTRFFRVSQKEFLGSIDQAHHQGTSLVYHEFDFKETVTQKKNLILSVPSLLDVLESPILQDDDEGLDCPNYHLHSIDLRELHPALPLPKAIREIDTTIPTVIISECCLIYLNADKVAKYFTKFLFPETTSLGFIIYEQILPNDGFGQAMEANLASRGIELETFHKYGSLAAQADRMMAYGFDDSGGVDMNAIWRVGITEEEKARLASLERVDEVEEWELIAAHYCVIWAWRGKDDEGTWRGWKEMEEAYQG